MRLVELVFAFPAGADRELMVAHGVEFLHPVVPAVRNVDVFCAICGDSFWIVKLPWAIAFAAKTFNKILMAIVDLDAVIEVVREDEISIRRAMKTGGGRQLFAVCVGRTEHRFKLSDTVLFHCLMGQIDCGQGDPEANPG